jgi:hypothetical protein
MSLELVESRPERGLGAISDSRGETISAIASELEAAGRLDDIRAASTDEEVLAIARETPGVDVDEYYRDISAPGAVDEYGAAPSLTVEQTTASGDRRTNAQEKDVLADAIRGIARGAYDADSTAGSDLSGQELRRRLRNAAEARLDNPDRWNIDAQAGNIGRGETQLVLQDPDTGRTRTLNLDPDDLQDPTEAVSDTNIGERAENIDWSSGNAEAPTSSGGSSGSGVLVAAAVAIGAAIIYGVMQ